MKQLFFIPLVILLIGWEYDKVLSIEKDEADKHRARVAFTDGDNSRSEYIKFQTEPTDDEIKNAVDKILVLLNTSVESTEIPLEQELDAQ